MSLQQSLAIALAAMLIGLVMMNSATFAGQSQPQLMAVSISVPNGARDQVFEKIQSYSDEYNWATRIAPTRPDGQSFVIQMWREDVKVIGTNALNANEFRLYFFQNCEGAVPQYLVRTLADGLKDAVREVQGATITDIN